MGVSAVTLRLPATSANLGPGFDCLALALELYAEVRVALGEGGGAGPAERQVLAAAQAACRFAGRDCPPLNVEFLTTVPHARGLGHSAICRAAGLLAAEALLDVYLQDHELLAVGSELEGHADNLAACLFGGLQVVVRSGLKVYRAGLEAPVGLRAVLFIPDFEMSTEAGRRLFPRQLSREDAVANLGRASLLVAALASGRYDLLDEATQDRLHQPARTQLFPQMPRLFMAAREAGALCAFLSGGGSTILALVRDGGREVAAAMQDAGVAAGVSARTRVVGLSADGAQAVVEGSTTAGPP